MFTLFLTQLEMKPKAITKIKTVVTFFIIRFLSILSPPSVRTFISRNMFCGLHCHLLWQADSFCHIHNDSITFFCRQAKRRTRMLYCLRRHIHIEMNNYLQRCLNCPCRKKPYFLMCQFCLSPKCRFRCHRSYTCSRLWRWCMTYILAVDFLNDVFSTPCVFETVIITGYTFQKRLAHLNRLF